MLNCLSVLSLWWSLSLPPPGAYSDVICWSLSGLHCDHFDCDQLWMIFLVSSILRLEFCFLWPANLPTLWHDTIFCIVDKALFLFLPKQTKSLHAATHRLKQQGRCCHLCAKTYLAGRLVFLPLKTLMCTMLACVGWMDFHTGKLLSERFHIETLFCKSLKERNQRTAHTVSQSKEHYTLLEVTYCGYGALCVLLLCGCLLFGYNSILKAPTVSPVYLLLMFASCSNIAFLVIWEQSAWIYSNCNTIFFPSERHLSSRCAESVTFSLPPPSLLLMTTWLYCVQASGF